MIVRPTPKYRCGSPSTRLARTQDARAIAVAVGGLHVQSAWVGHVHVVPKLQVQTDKWLKKMCVPIPNTPAMRWPVNTDGDCKLTSLAEVCAVSFTGRTDVVSRGYRCEPCTTTRRSPVAFEDHAADTNCSVEVVVGKRRVKQRELLPPIGVRATCADHMPASDRSSDREDVLARLTQTGGRIVRGR